ncbi:MAG: HAD family phosphatase, partial [Acidobacteriota bacterium]|nr:HAD family phosphatase [Acidobacteriota bacterium]
MIDTAIRGIVFDLDGVLIQSASSHSAAFKQVFARLDIQDFEYAQYAGWRTADVIVDVLKQRGRSESADVVADMARQKSRLARDLLEASRPLAKNCEVTLAELAGEFPLALSSSGSRPSVDAFLKLTGSRSLFRSVLSGEDVSQAKPDPEIYVRSAQELGLDARECLVIEDSLAGVKAARAAGCPVIAVPGTCSAEALVAAGAEQVVADLLELVGRPQPVDPACWTAVIPAAGRGTR